MSFLKKIDPLTVLFIVLVLVWLFKALYCARVETGWLTFEDGTRLEGCYYRKEGNSYLVQLKPCGILEGEIEIICPPGRGIDRVIIYEAHGEFKTDKVIYKF